MTKEVIETARKLSENGTVGAILCSCLLAAFSLFVNGFGIYLTIRANIGAAPWDVFNLGISHTFGILYGSASIAISFVILAIDILMREPIGIAMFIDAIVVGKSVDFFNALDLVPVLKTLVVSILYTLAGLVVIGYTQFPYMYASLGCGPRDTLLVGLKKRIRRVPIGVVSIALLGVVTLSGWLLGGQVGIGTLLCAFAAGPIMQFAFFTVRFDATKIRHSNLLDSAKVFCRAFRKKEN